VPPRYCSLHETSEMRFKMENPMYKECKSCHGQVHTNYFELALCAPCSDKERSCMVCGASAPKPGSYMPPGSISEASPPVDRTRMAESPRRALARDLNFDAALDLPMASPSPMKSRFTSRFADGKGTCPRPEDACLLPADACPLPAEASMTARYCPRHIAREMRPKVESRLMECTACRMTIMTPYAEFSFCAPCSEKQCQCVICGAATGGPAQEVARAGGPPPLAQVGCSISATAPPESSPSPVKGGPRGFGMLAPFTTKYCRLHDTSEKRIKGPPRLRKCSHCQLELQSTYKDFSLCGQCSDDQDRCTICGAASVEAWAGASGLLAQQALGVGAATPRYCSKHDCSEKRLKAEPRHQKCKGCPLSVNNTYAEFTFCPSCSEQRHQCMLCGDDADMGHLAEVQQLTPPHPHGKAQGQQQQARFPGSKSAKESLAKLGHPECISCREALPGNSELSLCNGCSERESGGIEIGEGQQRPGYFFDAFQVPPLAKPQLPMPLAAQRYCSMHATSEQRPKGPLKTWQCTSCRRDVAANYKEVSLCGPCSEGQGRCMICAQPAVTGPGFDPQRQNYDPNFLHKQRCSIPM